MQVLNFRGLEHTGVLIEYERVLAVDKLRSEVLKKWAKLPLVKYWDRVLKIDELKCFVF